jgi:hypothetical protein
VKIGLYAQLQRVVKKAFQLVIPGQQALPYQKHHALQPIKQQPFFQLSHWVSQDTIDEQKLYLFAVVGLLDTSHGEGDAEECAFDQRLRFKALNKPMNDTCRRECAKALRRSSPEVGFEAALPFLRERLEVLPYFWCVPCGNLGIWPQWVAYRLISRWIGQVRLGDLFNFPTAHYRGPSSLGLAESITP